MDSNRKFKGKIVKELIEKKGLTRTQAKKLICVGTIADGYSNILPPKARWFLATSPERRLHNFFYDLFLFAYDFKFPTFFRKKKGLRGSGFKGKKYISIVKDLFTFTPTFKTSPKWNAENKEEYLSSDQPTLKFILNEENWIKNIGLRLYFDLEGFISPCFAVKKKKNTKETEYQFQFFAHLGLSITNKYLAEEMKDLAESLKLSMKIRKDKRRWNNIKGIVTENKKYIFHFKNMGGSLTNLKIKKSKFNKNFSKQTILETCCEIFKRKNCSKHFSIKNKANQFREKFKENVFKPIRKRYQNKYDGGPGRI